MLFNEGAHIAHSVTRMNEPMRTNQASSKERQRLALQIKSKHNLAPSVSRPCLKCGIFKSLEALQGNGSPKGGNIIIISGSRSEILSKQDKDEVLTIVKKHKIKLFTNIIIHSLNNHFQSPFMEKISLDSGGLFEYYFPGNSLENGGFHLHMNLINTLQSIEQHTSPQAPFQV